MTTLLLKICAYGVCEGGWMAVFVQGKLPWQSGWLSAIKLFNQEDDHILVKVYLPVVISWVCGTEQPQQTSCASHKDEVMKYIYSSAVLNYNFVVLELCLSILLLYTSTPVHLSDSFIYSYIQKIYKHMILWDMIHCSRLNCPAVYMVLNS